MSDSKTNSEEKWERLPPTVLPTHYDLHITPDFTQYAFKGTVKIALTIKKAVSVIKLNAVDLVLHSGKVSQSGKEFNGKIEYQAKDETATITVDPALEAGKDAELLIDYTGTLNDKMHGFYRSHYKDPVDGSEKVLGCTQFEATDARRALPCWDEPAVKATFGVTLTVEKHLTAVSNMPAIQETESNGLVTYVYDRSPIMSTYLLGWVVGEFDMLEDKTSEGLPVRVFAVKGKGEQARFALEVACRAVPIFNKWFNYQYPLPKLDMLAIPDFSAGAMENFGMLTYRETAMLVDPANSSTLTKQWVAVVINHEISHQWFGNTVTMEWWSHLWLNEGFANWMETFITDKMFPEWDLWTQFLANDFNLALALDCLENTHPIEVDVNHPDEVDEIFDTISYSKGSVVVRMLENWLGAEMFQKAISHYIRKFEWRNAKSTDLWSTLQEVSGKPVSEMMEGWTRHSGFPVVQIHTEETQGDKIVYQVSQHRFMVHGIAKKDDTIWYCPISFLTNASKEAVCKQTFSTREGQLELTVDSQQPVQWVKLNAFQTGYYRVLYPESMLKKLQQAILNQDPNLTAADRLGLQSDAFAFARAGLMPVNQLLDLVDCYANETDYSVWADLSSNLIDFSIVIKDNDELYNQFSSWVGKLYSKILNTVGWEKQENDSHTDALLRTKVIATVGAKFNSPEVATEATKRFVEYFTAVTGRNESAQSVLPADLRGPVYAMAVRNGGLLGYETALQLMKHTNLQEERNRLAQSLAAATDPMLIVRTLQYALSIEVRKQDAPSLLSVIGGNRHALDLFWQFLMDNWSTVVEKWGGSFGMSRIIDTLGNFTDPSKADEIEQFFSDPKHPAPAGERAVKQALENIRSNAAWFNRDGSAIQEWLSKRV